MNGKRKFILTEACRLLPLARRILVDVRQARSEIAFVTRKLQRFDLSEAEELSLHRRKSHALDRLHEALAEADRLGIVISNGIRCEALFPFDHRWIGEHGDGKIRPAYFVFSDSEETITEWFFSGWPNDRRKANAAWRTIRRTTAV